MALRMRTDTMPVSPVAGQAIAGGFRADVIGNGILLEKPFQFLDPVNRPVGGTARAQQAANRQPVKRGRTDTNRRRFYAVQAQLQRLDFGQILFCCFQHAYLTTDVGRLFAGSARWRNRQVCREDFTWGSNRARAPAPSWTARFHRTHH